ncbi:MAG: branched-chain amino acid ABC transporter permease, partial [Acidimicrobiales bacterium]|nr:branched-chain amino acid ABC transporter permease [Acidimicrobiales bacterium]
MLRSLIGRARDDRNLAIAVAVGSVAGLWLLTRAYQGAGSTTLFLQFALIGISSGCVFAIAASGLVLTYTTTGVFNFAHGGVGMVAAFVYYQLNRELGVPVPLALLLVLGVLAPVLGLVLERILRSFRGAPAGTTLTVTIAITILLIGVAQYAWQSGGEDRIPTNLFGDRTVSVAGANLDWDEVAFLVIAIAVAVGLRYVLRITRTGVAMRAVVDNADLAGLAGAPPISIARISWVLGSVLAAGAGVLYAPMAGRLDAVTLTFFVLSAYGAAVFGKLRSLPLTFVGAIVLGLVSEL